MYSELEIGKNKYPIARCTNITNFRECGTAMNPARNQCRHCEERELYFKKRRL